MIELITLIIFLLSVLGAVFIIFRKIPVLVQLPQDGSATSGNTYITKVRQKVNNAYFHFFEKQMWLHKLLSWVKVLTLKVETKVDGLLSGIRKKAQQLDKEARKKQ